MNSAVEGSALLEQVLHAIEQDQIVLPTLPNVAVRVQEMLDDPNVSADRIVSVLSSDPFISAQIIKSANSSIFAGRPPVDNVRESATRLGYRQLRNLVINITMSNMLYSNNHVINQRMKQVWKHSREVAVVSYVLTSGQQHLSPDQAMLAGLLHNIGVLPLCQYIEKNQMTITDEELANLITRCSVMIGTRLLTKWNFSREIVEAVAESLNLNRESSNSPLADYADIVTFANLQDRTCAKMVAWNNVSAVKRLGLSEEECAFFLEHNADRIEQVEDLLGISTMEKPAIPRSSIPTLNKPENQPTSQPTRKKTGLFSFLMKLFK